MMDATGWGDPAMEEDIMDEVMYEIEIEPALARLTRGRLFATPAEARAWLCERLRRFGPRSVAYQVRAVLKKGEGRG